MTALTVGSLFTGIGGMDLGLERAGMKVVWQCEIDPYCTQVLARHWPDVPRFGDIRTVGAHNLAPVDVLCGGFPCQPHSLAGARKGGADDRNLWPEFARLIGELRPRWVLAENVVGLLTSDAGRFFGNVLRDLAACRYDAEWDCIPASAVGAPHRRDRVFLLAYPECAGLERSTGRGQSGQRWTPGVFAGLGEGLDGQWKPESNVGRVAYGVPSRVERLKALGNAVVPQVVELIGRQIGAVST